MSRSETAEQERCAVSPGEAPASAPVIGTLQTVIGSVTITRANLIVAAPGVGHPVYEGDVLETGDDGLVAITFVDGTALHLHANGRMALDEFVCGTKESNSALIRIAKGVFGFVAGKLAAEGRLAIDTPLGQLRNRAPAVGIGSLALGVFTFALIRELKADSADIAFLDNGTIDYKDLKHGVFEIVTKGDHPQVIVVDDPTETIEIRKHGSSYSVSQLANTPEEMAQLQSAYAHAYANYQAGLNDVFIQQWQHANAQPQSTGAGGSSTSLALLEIPNNSPRRRPTSPPAEIQAVKAAAQVAPARPGRQAGRVLVDPVNRIASHGAVPAPLPASQANGVTQAPGAILLITPTISRLSLLAFPLS